MCVPLIDRFSCAQKPYIEFTDEPCGLTYPPAPWFTDMWK